MHDAVKDHYGSPERAREEALEGLRPITHAQPGTSWDAFIRVMQVLLPVGAIILGLVTVSWPFINETEVSFTLSRDDVAKSDGIIRMTNMQYVGTDTKDRLFRIRAEGGEQDNPNAPRIRLSGIDAEMELGEGTPATVNARTGIYRTENDTLSLVGGVNLKTGNGYFLEMSGAEVDLKSRSAAGQGSVRGTSELGELTAGRMNLSVREKEAVFEGGVTLHIVPKRPSAATPASEGP